MTIKAAAEPNRRENEMGHGNKVGYAHNQMKRRKLRRKMRHSSYSSLTTTSMALRELFVSCKQVFKGPGTVPLPLDEVKLCNIIDNMKPEDVGLSSQLQFFTPKAAIVGTPRVTYTTIYQSDNFSLCIFFLPENAVIPLHNHPGMTVFSKLLLGTMHIKSYDWVDTVPTTEPDLPSQFRLARVKANRVFASPCSTSVLYPTTGGNIHQFKAVTPCAVLDVMGPPYSHEEGRDCSYYEEVPYNAFSDKTRVLIKEEEREDYGWLREIDVPENSQMDGIEYLGPRVDKSCC